MAFGTLLAALAPTALKLGAGFLSSKIGGNDEPDFKSGGTAGFAPSSFSGGGLTGNFDGNNATVASDGTRRKAVNSLARLFPQQADLTAGLREQVSPGFSALRKAQLGQIEDARAKSIGNLKDNLGRRRVLGSSFGQDAVSRSEAEFAKTKAGVEAQTTIQEIGLTDKFIKDEFDLRRGEFTTVLTEMGIQADLAADMAKQATTQLAANARIKEQLNFKGQQASSEGAGQFFGQNLDPAFAAIGKSLGGAFTGGGGDFGGGGSTGSLSSSGSPMFFPGEFEGRT